MLVQVRLLSAQVAAGASVDAITASVLRNADINLALQWEGVGQQFLRLHGPVEHPGSAIILVGDYVGSEYKCLLVLQQLRSRALFNLPVYDFFGDHEYAHPETGRARQEHIFAGTSGKSVQQAICKTKTLSKDQRHMIRTIRTSSRRALCVQACPGNGKTVVAMGLLLANFEKQKNYRKATALCGS